MLVFILALGFYITPALLGGQRDVISMPDRPAGHPHRWGYRRRLRADPPHRRPRRLHHLHPHPRRRAPLRGDTGMRRPAGSKTADRSSSVVSRQSAVSLPSRLSAHLGWSSCPYVITTLILFPDLPDLVVVRSRSARPNSSSFPAAPASPCHRTTTLSRGATGADATLLSLQRRVRSPPYLATVSGTLASSALVRRRFPGRQPDRLLLVSPLVIPSIIVAIGIYFFYARLQIVGHPFAPRPRPRPPSPCRSSSSTLGTLATASTSDWSTPRSTSAPTAAQTFFWR